MGELLDNFLKVYQLANFIKHSQLQTELERQRLEQQQEEYQFQRVLHDFQLGQHLEDIGGTRVKPIGDIQPGFGSDWLEAAKRRQVTTPMGVTYQVPTFQERQDRLRQAAIDKAMIAAQSKGMEEAAKQPFTTTEVALPGLGPFGSPKKVRIPNSSLPTYYRAIEQTKDEKTRSHYVTNPETGDTTLIIERLNKAPDAADRTVKVELGTIGGGGIEGAVRKQQALMPGKIAEATAIAKATEPYRRQAKDTTGLSTGAQKALKQAQRAIDDARETPSPAMWEKADEAAKQAAESFPTELEYGKAGGSANVGMEGADYPYIKPKPGRGSAAVVGSQATSTTDPRIGKIFVGPNGTRYMVKGIAPSGKAIVEPVQ